MVLPAFLCVFTPWKVIITANVHELSDMETFEGKLPPLSELELGYLEKKTNAKRWIEDRDDLEAYQAFSSGATWNGESPINSSYIDLPSVFDDNMKRSYLNGMQFFPYKSSNM